MKPTQPEPQSQHKSKQATLTAKALTAKAKARQLRPTALQCLRKRHSTCLAYVVACHSSADTMARSVSNASIPSKGHTLAHSSETRVARRHRASKQSSRRSLGRPRLVSWHCPLFSASANATAPSAPMLLSAAPRPPKSHALCQRRHLSNPRTLRRKHLSRTQPQPKAAGKLTVETQACQLGLTALQCLRKRHSACLTYVGACPSPAHTTRNLSATAPLY